MTSTDDVLAAAIAKQQKLIYWRNYYDQNRERILARQMTRYYEKRKDQDRRRGPKPKSREIVIKIGPGGEVCVADN